MKFSVPAAFGGDALGGEIKVREVVAAELGAKRVALARYASQRDAQQNFAHAASVERRGVDEVQPAVECDADALQRFVELHAAEFLPKRRCAEAEDWKFEAGIAEGAGFHPEAFGVWCSVSIRGPLVERKS